MTLLLALLASTDGPQAPPAKAQAEPAPPAMLRLARELLAAVPPEATSYRHKDNVIRWPADGAPACHGDCSGFVNELVVRTYGRDKLAAWLGSKRPLATHYVTAIRKGLGFRRIDQVADLRGGDVLAMRYEPGNENTGHVVLLAEAPRPLADAAPKPDGRRSWAAPVIDVTSSPHGKGDSRRDGSRHKNAKGETIIGRPGLGKGTLRLEADADGRIAGYAWTLDPNSAFHPQESRLTVAGRLPEAPPKPPAPSPPAPKAGR